MKMSNRRNRLIYRLWAPFYDALLERLFHRGRTRTMAVAAPLAQERVCFIGVGTGADLLLLPEGVFALGVDLSETMLDRARRKLPLPNREIALRSGDAQSLPIADTEEPFDVVMLNLILSVVPNAKQCLSEALRIVKPGGRIVVFDKFLPEGVRPSWGRRLANLVTTAFGTDINRRLGDMLSGLPCRVELDEPSILRGTYRVVLLRPTTQ